MVKLIGILNITPDSFSDGGIFLSNESALAHCQTLINDGADIIDVGAESTRPGAIALSADEEWKRLSPILASLIELCHQHHKLISLDTRHVQTARHAIALGIDWINDVSGLDQPAMLELAASSKISWVVMHHLGIPADPMITLPDKDDPLVHLLSWIQTKKQTCQQYGIDLSRVIFDPGIGFGKTAAQSIKIIQHIDQLTHLPNTQILVGHSRKSFLKNIYPDLSKIRDEETLEISKMLAENKVAFLRVHDIALHHAIK